MLLLALLACKAAPEGLVLTLSPQVPTTVHDLELDVQVRDPDGQQVSLDIQWTPVSYTHLTLPTNREV